MDRNSAARVVAAVMSVSATGIGMIQQHEGMSYGVYLDPVGLPTVCWGHMDRRLKVGTRYSKSECTRFLKEDLGVAEAAVSTYVTVPLTQGQFDSLVSLVFNIGVANFRKSTLLRKLNDGDYNGAALEFPKWVYSKGQKLPGLVTRRNDEMERFLNG